MSSGAQSANVNTSADGVRTTAEYGDPTNPTPASGSRWFHNFSAMDGGIVTVGKTTDAAALTGNGTLMSMLRRIRDVLHNAQLAAGYTPLKNNPKQVQTQTTVASASYGAGTTNLADLTVSEYKDVLVLVNVTAIVGSVTISWQVKTSVGTYGTHSSTVISTTGVGVVKVNAPTGITGRVSLSVGTSMTATVDMIGE